MRAALDTFADRPCKLSAGQTQSLLDQLCVKLGYCLTPQDYEAIEADPPTDPMAFAELVMKLDGVDPVDREMLAPVLKLVLATFEGAARAEPSD